MKLAPIALALGLAACAAAPRTERSYELRTTVYEMPTELAQKLAGSQAAGGHAAPAGFAGQVAEATRSRSDVEARSRPMIRVHEGSTAEISNMSETDYVQDYAIGADGKAQAVHAKAAHGLALELKPTRRDSGLEIAYHVELSQLVQWTEESERTLSNGETVKMKLPIVAKRGLRSTTALSKGECLAVMLSPTESGRTTLVCVEAVAVSEGR